MIIKNVKNVKLNTKFVSAILNIQRLKIIKILRGGIYHVIHQYAKANNKYMKDYDKNKE